MKDIPGKINEILPGVFCYGKMLLIKGEESYILYDPGERPENRRVVEDFIEREGKPIKYIILSHSHYDHSYNIRFFKDYKLIKGKDHSKNIRFKPDIEISKYKKMTIDSVEMEFFPMPGHSKQKDDLIICITSLRLLLVGDYYQPQGPIYHKVNAFSPIPFFNFGDEFLASLDTLIKMNYDYIFTGAGILVPHREAKKGFILTRDIVRRIDKLASKLISENPNASIDTISHWIFDTISHERNFHANQHRKYEIFHFPDTMDKVTDKSLYEIFDKPGIDYFVKKNMDTALSSNDKTGKLSIKKKQNKINIEKYRFA